jgi:hypothetical protein
MINLSVPWSDRSPSFLGDECAKQRFCPSGRLLGVLHVKGKEAMLQRRACILQCTATIAQYAPIIFQSLDEILDPRMVCKKLHVCPGAASVQAALEST